MSPGGLFAGRPSPPARRSIDATTRAKHKCLAGVRANQNGMVGAHLLEESGTTGLSTFGSKRARGLRKRQFPGHNWCTAAPCTMAWFIGIAMHLHLGASQLPGTVLHRAPRCIRPLRHPHRGACQPYCTECAPAPRCIPALLNVSLTLGQHCNSTKKTSEVKY